MAPRKNSNFPTDGNDPGRRDGARGAHSERPSHGPRRDSGGQRRADSARPYGRPPRDESLRPSTWVLPDDMAPRPLAADSSEPIPALFLRSPTRSPLVYRKRVASAPPQAKPGDLVSVYAQPDQLLGYGIYNPLAEIAVRMVSFGAEFPDDAFWSERLSSALHLRRNLLRLDEQTDACRIIHAEGDGFPGLVVDRFGDVLSAEGFSLGMFQRGPSLLEKLGQMCGTKHWRLRAGPLAEMHERFLARDVASPECPRDVVINEFGTKFRIRFDESHKTGFFCDQRENRAEVARFCRGGSMLDLCCYTGGFSVQAMKLGGAAEATGVDLDEQPLQLAKENARLNQVKAKFVQADVFPFMRDMIRNGRKYDVVVLDPPKLIRTREEFGEGKRAHFDLNRLAIQLVKPGGVLISCTCAGLLPPEEFLQLVYAAAGYLNSNAEDLESGGEQISAYRSVQLLRRTGAAADHPIAGNCPETEYLKTVWLRVV